MVEPILESTSLLYYASTSVPDIIKMILLGAIKPKECVPFIIETNKYFSPATSSFRREVGNIAMMQFSPPNSIN